MRFIAIYCASGPYRHVRDLVENARPDWFPWGPHGCSDNAERPRKDSNLRPAA
jgi:hypothetical protein